jgi:replication initiation protein RepC
MAAKRGGGRIASPAYRQSLAQCEGFAGLDEDTNPYELLLLAKKVGKLAGFTPAAVRLLEYYFAFTRAADWRAGSRPIVFQSVVKTALDLGVSERQVQKLEKTLFELGAIGYNDHGSHKRFGSRDPKSGRIKFAFGVDLSPLAYLREDLENSLHEKQLRDRAWLATKRDISACRRQIRSLLLELREEGSDAGLLLTYEGDYDKIALQLRTHIPLEELRSLLARHKSLYSRVLEFVDQNTSRPFETAPRAKSGETTNSSSRNEQKFAHNQYTNPRIKYQRSHDDNCFQEKETERSAADGRALACGLTHIRLDQVLQVASERFREYLPVESERTNWNDVVEAAYRLRPELNIGQQSWADACQLVGRVGAALCVLVTDQACQRSVNSVQIPVAYFEGMIRKAAEGKLRLHNSIFGLLERKYVQAGG